MAHGLRGLRPCPSPSLAASSSTAPCRASSSATPRALPVGPHAVVGPDGAVEALFEGEPQAVDALVAFAREGPRGAQVDRVDVEEAQPEGLGGFEIR